MLDLDRTTDHILSGVDLAGKIVIVTGGSGGLGAETARAFASRRQMLETRSGRKVEDRTQLPYQLPAAYGVQDIDEGRVSV